MKEESARSRRDFFKAGLAAGVGAALPGSNAQAKDNGNSDAGDDGLTFVNGRIHTMDDHNRVVNAVAIRNGRFVRSATRRIRDRATTSSICTAARWCRG